MANVEKIRIKNFKSHENFLQNIDRNFNHVVVHGRNGVGKTNLLESFSFFSNTKGMRGDNIEKVIPIMQNPKGDTDVSLVLFSKYNNLNLNLFVSKNEDLFKKTFYFNDKKTTLANIKNYISFLWLSPYMDKIMYEGQSIKRNFVDKMISQNNINFYRTLISYKKNISERINILRNSKDDKWLNIIEEKISENMYEILKIRRSYANLINNIINEKLKNFRLVEIKYVNKFIINLEDKNNSIQNFNEKLKMNRNIDEISKRTNFGINSDEITFFDTSNQISTVLCSTGEQKSSLLTIILANCWKLKEEKKEFILLLDEATSHIDEINFLKLFNEVCKFNTQIWYTGTSKNLFQVIENKGFFIHLQ